MNSERNPDESSTKPWNYPLTTEDMRSRASTWSLADDSQLLAYLESISQSITSRSYEIQKQLDSLIHETRISGVKVNNVINDFNHLSSLQFIENRVYDEEAKEPEPRDSQNGGQGGEESKEQQEAKLVLKVKEAFQLGIQVVQSSLELVDLHQDSEEDSDDEELSGPRAEPLLRSRDPYLDRPLPLLIGSQAFVQDDKVGLGDLLSDEEEDEKSSRIELESDKSESDFDADEQEKPPPMDNKMADMMQREYGNHVESDEELFGDKEELHSPESSSGVDSEEDMVAPVKEGLSKRSSILSRKTDSSLGTSKVGDDLFGASDEDSVIQEDEKNHSPFKKKKGAFSGDGKLFDDDADDEGDLFREAPPPMERARTISMPKAPLLTQSGKKVPAGGVSMLGGSGMPPLLPSMLTSNKMNEDAEEPKPAPRKNPVPQAAPLDGKLFDAVDSDEDDGLFRNSRVTASKEQADKQTDVSSNSKRIGLGTQNDLFNSSPPAIAEDDNDLFGDVQESRTKGLADSKDALPISKPVVSRTPSKLFDSSPPVNAGAMPPPPKLSKPVSAPASGLFDDDDDDDLWVPASTTTKELNTPRKEADSPKENDILVETKVPKGGGLFEDDEDNLLFSSSYSTPKTEAKPEKSFLFEDDDDDIFADAKLPPKPAQPANSTSSLFSKGSEVDGPVSGSTKLIRGRTGSKSLFFLEDEIPTQKNTLGIKEEPQPAPAPVTKSQGRNPISLFDEEEEDEDLFADKPPQVGDSQSSQSSSWSTGSKGETEAVPVDTTLEQDKRPRTGSRFLFEQEDELFKGVAEDSLDVDLFAAPVKTNTVDTRNTKKPPGGVSLFGSGGSSLFGDELKKQLEKRSSHEDKDEEPETEQPKNSKAIVSAPVPTKRPPPEDTKVASVGFDEPADQIKTLISATKDRAKIQTKRRPPSRKTRHAGGVSVDRDSSSPSSDAPVSPPVQRSVPSMEEALPVVPAEPAEEPKSHAGLFPPRPNLVKSPSTEEEDLFSVVENSLKRVPEAKPKSAPSAARSSEATKSQVSFKDVFDDSGEEDLFSTVKNVPDTSRSRISNWAANSDSETMVSNDFLGSGDSSTRVKESSKNAYSILFEQSDEDGEAATKHPQLKQSTSIFDDDDTDIFTSSLKSLPSQKKRTTLFDNDTDDIFSAKPGVPRTNPSEKKSTPVVKKALQKTRDFKDPLLGDIDEDD